MIDFVQGSIFDDLPAHVRDSREHGEQQLAEVMGNPNNVLAPRHEIKRAPVSLEVLCFIAPEIATATLLVGYLSFIAHRKRLPNPAELWASMQLIVHDEPFETLGDPLGREFLQEHVPQSEQQVLLFLIIDNQLEIANFPADTDDPQPQAGRTV